MNPEEIQGREFLVGLRGYDKDEVQAFLADVALEYEALQRENDELRNGGGQATIESLDEFESLGASVAAVLRAAKESAAEITTGADQMALQVREEADQYASSLRHQAEQILAEANVDSEALRHRVSQELEEQRRAAAVALADARAEADRILREANERAGSLSLELEARTRSAEALLADADARIAKAQRQEETVRQRLREASEEIALAMLALDDDHGNHTEPHGAASSSVG